MVEAPLCSSASTWSGLSAFIRNTQALRCARARLYTRTSSARLAPRSCTTSLCSVHHAHRGATGNPTNTGFFGLELLVFRSSSHSPWRGVFTRRACYTLALVCARNHTRGKRGPTHQPAEPAVCWQDRLQPRWRHGAPRRVLAIHSCRLRMRQPNGRVGAHRHVHGYPRRRRRRDGRSVDRLASKHVADGTAAGPCNAIAGQR